MMEAIRDGIAGINGGLITVVVGQPFDTVKVLLQTNQYGHQISASQCAIETYRRRGILGLYAGSAPSILAHAYENAFLFMFYEQFQRMIPKLGLESFEKSSPFLMGASAGGLAACLSSVLLTPIELVKCQLQSNHVHRSASAVVRSIVTQNGIGGLFTGLGPTLAREIPGNIAMFGGYEACKELLSKQSSMSVEAQTLIAGGVGGMSFWAVSLPMDTLAAREQVLGPGVKNRFGVFHSLKNVVMMEGVGALYSGFAPVMVRAFLTNAAMFYVVEETKKLFKKEQDAVWYLQ